MSRFEHATISRIVDTGDIAHARKVLTAGHFFLTDTRTAWNELLTFYQQHGTTPSRELFDEMIGGFEWAQSFDPVAALADKMHEHYIYNKIAVLMGEMATMAPEDSLRAAQHLVAQGPRFAALAHGSTATPAVDEFTTVHIDDVPDATTPTWLIEDLWRGQACGIIGGKPKAFGGKSWLSLELAISVASGTPAFGTFDVPQRGHVLYFNAEDPPHESRDRVRKLCRAKGIDPKTMGFEMIDVRKLSIDNPEHVAKMRRLIEKEVPDLVVLDPLRNLHGRDENDSNEMAPLLQVFRDWQRDFGCCVMLVHHVIKDGAANSTSWRGSGVFGGWFDSGMTVSVKGEQPSWDAWRSVYVEQRNAPPPERPIRFRLQRSLDTGRGVAALDEKVWLELEEAGAHPGADDELAGQQAKIVAALQRAGKPLGLRAIERAAKIKNGKAKVALAQLVTAGIVKAEIIGSNTYYSPSRSFVLDDDSDAVAPLAC